MAGCEVGPGITEKKAHDPGAQFDVRLAFSSFNVRLSQITQVMNCAGDPYTDVPRESKKLDPRSQHKPKMEPECVRPEKYTSSPDGHTPPLRISATSLRDLTKSAPAALASQRCSGVSDIRDSASCPTPAHIACTA